MPLIFSKTKQGIVKAPLERLPLERLPLERLPLERLHLERSKQSYKISSLVKQCNKCK